MVDNFYWRMAEYVTNSLRAEDKGFSQVSSWLVDPFGSVLKQLKDGKCHILRSPVIRTWWGDEWWIRLNFFQLYISPRQFGVQTAILREKTEAASYAWKGTYHFRVAAFSAYTEYDLHCGSDLSSVYSTAICWQNLEPLKLRIEIKFLVQENVPRFEPEAINLLKRFATIKETEEFHDFSIFVCEEELRTNKTILALASPVFLAMFCHDFKEKQAQSVHINDVSIDTVRKFIDFIHTSKPPNFTDLKSIIELLHIAEKYDVLELKKICLECINLTFADEA